MNDNHSLSRRISQNLTRRQFWVLLLIMAMGLMVLRTLTTGRDLTRNGVDFQWWEPWVWELSSFWVWILCFVILANLFKRIHGAGYRWPRLALAHLGLSIVCSAFHVLLMVLIRKLVYFALGTEYDFGPWLAEWWYEYRKDAITYSVFLALWHAVSHLYSRSSTQQKLMIKNHQGVRWIAYVDIISVESSGNYVYLNCRDEVVSYRSTLANMARLLQAHGFVRVHRSFLVRQAAIKSVQFNKDPAQLQLQDGKTVPVSRKHKPELKALMNAETNHA